MKNYIIIGGVAGGASTAARLRRIDEKAHIILFERGKYISYANCGLPYYIGDVIKEREKLFVQTAEDFSKRFRIDVRPLNEVVEIDADKKQVLVRDLEREITYTESYDKLVLSPGAKPLRPPISGVDSENVFTLRNVEDTDQIKQFILTNRPKSAVVIGAGYIGIEMAENLHKLGIAVSLIEMADRVLPFFDYEIATALKQHLSANKVSVFLKKRVVSIDQKGEKLVTLLDSGERISGELIILAAGVRPDTAFLKSSGIKLSENGSILVDDYLRTNIDSIYAIGDAVQSKHLLSDELMNAYLAGPANKQGRIVADNLVYGDKVKFQGMIGTAIIKVFDLTAGIVGLSETALIRNNLRYKSSVIHSSSNAGYYPGALPLTLKLLFDRDKGTILGAQIIGFNGVDKRLDVLAALIGKNGTVYDLTELEHAYAPPYSSARDPLTISGYVAENILTGKVKILHINDIDNEEFRNALLLDVRTEEEHKIGAIPNSLNIPLDSLRERLTELPKEREIIIFCRVGLRGYLAYRILNQNGFENIYNLSGGYKSYQLIFGKDDESDIYAGEVIHSDDLLYPETTEPDLGEAKVNLVIDACGLQCPGPILKLKETLDQMKNGELLEIKATDPGFSNDLKSWCRLTGNGLVSLIKEGNQYLAKVKKLEQKPNLQQTNSRADNKTLIVFSDDMDRALASFVIANGAASTGKPVTMFFTFWGLNVIKRVEKAQAKRDLMGKMFGMMLPSDSRGLNLSKMSMLGMGRKMMRSRMRSKNIDSLEEMMQTALRNGIRMIACQMSMDVMGVVESDLIDGVEIGGVATYLEEAEKSNLNLFI